MSFLFNLSLEGSLDMMRSGLVFIEDISVFNSFDRLFCPTIIDILIFLGDPVYLSGLVLSSFEIYFLEKAYLSPLIAKCSIP